jgi:hypothetical protein
MLVMLRVATVSGIVAAGIVNFENEPSIAILQAWVVNHFSGILQTR